MGTKISRNIPIRDIVVHGDDARVLFNGMLRRKLLIERQPPDGLLRPEMADSILNQHNPLVEANPS